MQSASAAVIANPATVFHLTGGEVSKLRPIDMADVLAESKALPGDLVVVFFTDGDPDAAVVHWLGDAVVVKDPRGWEIRWRPGRASIRGPVKVRDSLLKAVAVTEAGDRQLREIEAAVVPVEAVAPGDVDFAYTISIGHRSRWKRFDQTIKSLYRLRLKLSKFDPAGQNDLDRRGRRAVSRLSAGLRFTDRAEILSDRLEVLEDLYEGAVDRITDHRWYVIGIFIEVLITLLLAAETLLLILRSGR